MQCNFGSIQSDLRAAFSRVLTHHDRLFLLVDADVIDLHSLRPDVLVDTLRPTPGSPDGDIEQKVERLVERPLSEIDVGSLPRSFENAKYC